MSVFEIEYCYTYSQETYINMPEEVIDDDGALQCPSNSKVVMWSFSDLVIDNWTICDIGDVLPKIGFYIRDADDAKTA